MVFLFFLFYLKKMETGKWVWTEWAENVVERIKDTNNSVKNLESEIKSTIKEINEIKNKLTIISSNNTSELIKKDIDNLSSALQRLSDKCSEKNGVISKNKETISEYKLELRNIIEKLSFIDINNKDISGIKSDMRNLSEKIIIIQNEINKFNGSFELFNEFKTKVKTLGTCAITTFTIAISILAVIATATKG